jgi:RNA polymerase sigma-70 factor (ECF subfamily)
VCAECPGRLARDVDAAFPELVAHHEDLVYGIALRMTRQHADAEDLAQEAFIRAHRALKGYAAERIVQLRLRGWLAAIVANLARDRGRRQAASGGAAASLDGVADWLADATPGPERVVAERESARDWQARLAALPARYRRAVELRHVDGLSYPELAEALDRPLGTVKSDVHRGVRLLLEAWHRDEAARTGRGSTR